MRLGSRIGLTAVSAVAAATAFEPLGWWPVALVAWVPLWVAVHGADARLGFRLGLLHGLLLHGITLAWFWNIFGTLAIGLWLILAAFTGLATSIAGHLSTIRPTTWWLPWTMATAWTGVEYFRSEWFVLSFPWITPGTAIGPTALSSVIGVYAATFLIMLAAAGLAARSRVARLTGSVALILLAALVILRPGPLPVPSAARVPVAAVQGESLDFHSYLRLTRDHNFQSGVVVWPEYASLYYAGPTRNPWVEAIDLCRDKDLVLVFGTMRQDLTGKPRQFNEALTIDASGVLGAHVKNRPVHFLSDGEKGRTANAVATRHGAIGTPVCFDCDTQEVVRRMVSHGAEWIAAPTMDALHWGPSQRLQHAALFRHRAAENGRWIVVAATSGLTQIIDANGVCRASLPWPAEAVLVGEIARSTRQTLFTRIGWLFGPLATVITLVLVIITGWTHKPEF